MHTSHVLWSVAETGSGQWAFVSWLKTPWCVSSHLRATRTHIFSQMCTDRFLGSRTQKLLRAEVIHYKGR